MVGSTFYGTTTKGALPTRGPSLPSAPMVSASGHPFFHRDDDRRCLSQGGGHRLWLDAHRATVNGGTADDGTVFSLSTNGTGFQLLRSFAGTTRRRPFPSAPDTRRFEPCFRHDQMSRLHSANSGTVFRWHKWHRLQLLHTFVNGATTALYLFCPDARRFEPVRHERTVAARWTAERSTT